MKPYKIKVSQCHGCPFSYSYEMEVGYGCHLSDKLLETATIKRSIKQSKRTYMPVTPPWCPLKSFSALIEFEK